MIFETIRAAEIAPRIRLRTEPVELQPRRRLQPGKSSLSRGPERAFRLLRGLRQAQRSTPLIRRQHELAPGRPVRLAADAPR